MLWATLLILILGIGAIWLLHWSPFLMGLLMLVAIIAAAAITDRFDLRTRGTRGDARKADMEHPMGAYEDPDSAAGGWTHGPPSGPLGGGGGGSGG